MHTTVDDIMNTPLPPTSPPLQRKQQERNREAACSYIGRIRFQKERKPGSWVGINGWVWAVFLADSGVTRTKKFWIWVAACAFYRGDKNDGCFLGPWWDGMKWHGFKRQPWTWCVAESEFQKTICHERGWLCAPLWLFISPSAGISPDCDTHGISSCCSLSYTIAPRQISPIGYYFQIVDHNLPWRTFPHPASKLVSHSSLRIGWLFNLNPGKAVW